MDTDPLKLSLHIDGVLENGKELRLSALIDKLDAFKGALVECDKMLSGADQRTAEFFVSNLARSNPLEVEIREQQTILLDSRAKPAITFFVEQIAALTAGRPTLADDNYSLLEKIKQIGDGAGRKYSRIWFAEDGETVATYTQQTFDRVQSLLGRVIRSLGSVRGRIKRYNSHADDKNFYIYPPLGGKVKCVFSEELRDAASASVEKFVTVRGLLKSREGQFNPFEIEVARIEPHPGNDALPKLSDFVGIDRSVGGGNSEDVIKQGRHDWR